MNIFFIVFLFELGLFFCEDENYSPLDTMTKFTNVTSSTLKVKIKTKQLPNHSI